MADKLRTLQQLESLQAKYVGTGHADTSRYEWSNNIVRDSYASYVGHPPLLAYMALGMGEMVHLQRKTKTEAEIWDNFINHTFRRRRHSHKLSEEMTFMYTVYSTYLVPNVLSEAKGGKSVGDPTFSRPGRGGECGSSTPTLSLQTATHDSD
ncbi:hypothetical protein B0A52_00908 [Exophiala mesophila]|uniref:Splicing factor subunit n=1 Tax=Exophiala mesophila TaxID=212818 RepID=A0A438NIJ8_EXOME|nr:hypothetical protein B0A52_00908 [Exophiala mesophila]